MIISLQHRISDLIQAGLGLSSTSGFYYVNWELSWKIPPFSTTVSSRFQVGKTHGLNLCPPFVSQITVRHIFFCDIGEMYIQCVIDLGKRLYTARLTSLAKLWCAESIPSKNEGAAIRGTSYNTSNAAYDHNNALTGYHTS